jgi:hypothetical protein
LEAADLQREPILVHEQALDYLGIAAVLLE